MALRPKYMKLKFATNLSFQFQRQKAKTRNVNKERLKEESAMMK